MAKTLQGVVTSDVADKTIVVTVRTRKTHPIYKKQFTINKKFMAHDEKNEAKTGDKVIISETRPVSARKRFKLDVVVVKATVKHVEPEPVPVAEEKPVKIAEKTSKTVAENSDEQTKEDKS